MPSPEAPPINQTDPAAIEADAALQQEPSGTTATGTELVIPTDDTHFPSEVPYEVPSEKTPAPGAVPETAAPHPERHRRLIHAARHAGRAAAGKVVKGARAVNNVTFADSPENEKQRHDRRVAKREARATGKGKAKAQENLGSKPKVRSVTEMHDLTGHTPEKPKAKRPESSGKFKNRLRSQDDIKGLVGPAAEPDPNQPTATPDSTAPVPPKAEKTIIPKTAEEIEAEIEASKYDKQLDIRAARMLKDPKTAADMWLLSMQRGKYALWSERDIAKDLLRQRDAKQEADKAAKIISDAENAQRIQEQKQRIIGRQFMENAARDIPNWNNLTPPERTKALAIYADREARRHAREQKLSLQMGQLLFETPLGQQLLADAFRAEQEKKKAADKDDDKRKGGKPAGAGRR